MNTEIKTVTLQLSCNSLELYPEVPANGKMTADITGISVQELLEALHCEVSPAELVATFGLDYFLKHVDDDDINEWLNENIYTVRT